MDYVTERLQRIDKVLSGDEVPDLYSLLHQDARSWWYHAQLRRRGELDEARVKEREQVREQIKSLRLALENGGYATIARSGGNYTLTVGDGHTVSGHNERIIISAYLVGLPVLDFRSVDDVGAIMSMPMAVIGDQSHWHDNIADDMKRLGDKYPTSMSYVYLADYFQRAIAIGATIHHAPTKRTRDNHYEVQQ